MNLTARGIVAAACAALLGVAGQWSPALGAFPWWRALVILLVLALVYEWLTIRRAALYGRPVAPDHLYLGRESKVEVEVENASSRSWRVRYAPVLPDVFAGPLDSRTLTVADGSTVRDALPVRPIVLGEHRWGPLPARVEGPLRLAWWSRPLSSTTVKIVPDTAGTRRVRAGSETGGSTALGRTGAGLEFRHLREYVQGDPRHMIDWKAYARTDRLYTRTFSDDQHLEVVVMLDVGRTSRTQIDGMSQLGHYVNLTARFAEYCVAGDDQVGLVAFADGVVAALRPDRGLRAVRRMRSVLSGLATRPVESDVLGAALRVRRIVQHRCLVVVLTDLYEHSATSQLVQTTRLLVPKHLPFAVGLLGKDTIALGARGAEGWLDPYRAFAAREYLRNVESNASRLARLGAHALVARPAELDNRVLSQYARLRAQHRI